VKDFRRKILHHQFPVKEKVTYTGEGLKDEYTNYVVVP